MLSKCAVNRSPLVDGPSGGCLRTGIKTPRPSIYLTHAVARHVNLLMIPSTSQGLGFGARLEKNIYIPLKMGNILSANVGCKPYFSYDMDLSEPKSRGSKFTPFFRRRFK